MLRFQVQLHDAHLGEERVGGNPTRSSVKKGSLVTADSVIAFGQPGFFWLTFVKNHTVTELGI